MVSTARKKSQRIGPVERVMSILPHTEVAPPWTDHVVDSYHGRISVRETSGTGIPLMLVHGNSSSKEAFHRQMMGALGARHRMIAIDLPGHGQSEDARDPQSSYTIMQYADALIDVAERLGLVRFAILGWSLGGHVALEAAASAPGVVGVMIVGTPPIGTSLEAASSAFRPNPLVALASQAMLSESEIVDFARLAGIDGELPLIAALRRADGRARGRVFEDVVTGGASDEREIVANLCVPLAVVNGADDPIVNLAYVQGLRYGSLWEDRFHTFPHAGHAPFLDVPDLFNATLARFMHELERRAGDWPTTPGLCLGG
jgi:pimeloyl-ACP methyl ester carboxylesterase